MLGFFCLLLYIVCKKEIMRGDFMYKVLVIEDDKNFQELMITFLESDNYIVTAANDGLEAISIFQKERFDLVIVDVMLPLANGYEVSKIIRKKSTVPIIMVTALSEEKNQVEGFDLGIDDYVTKPLSFSVFLKKVKALLNRTYGGEKTNLLIFKNIKINLDEYTVYIDNRPIELTHKEYSILVELMLRPKQVLTREQLINKIWGYDFFGDTNIVNQHIKNLRKKLGTGTIKSIKNIGYKIDD